MAKIHVGIDLGTTFTAAAMTRDGGQPEMVSLGPSGASIPSVVYLREDGTIATGTAALQRSAAEPERVASEFKRRVGDPAPIFMAGTPMAAHLLMARLLQWVCDRITEREGENLAHVVITHPANWGDYKRDYLRQAAERAGLESWSTLTEPEAAAIHYATRERIEPGETVAVYDLGGGTFDAAILRRTPESFEFVGRPHGIENLGGVDFDQTIFNHVIAQVSEHLSTLDENDPAVVSALNRLRRDAETAKIALSSETDTAIPITLPGLHSTVRLTRTEFEDMIRPTLGETIESLQQALAAAGVTPDDLAKVLLVGGSSRIPLVAQMVTDVLGRPVAVDADPKHSIALGAALHARVAAGAAEAAPPATTHDEPVPEKPDSPEAEDPVDVAAPVPEAPAAEDPVEPPSDRDQEQTAAPATAPATADGPPSDGSRTRRWLAGAGIIAAIIVIGLFVVRPWDGGGGTTDDTTAATAPGTTTGPATTSGIDTTSGDTATTAPPDLSGTEIRLAAAEADLTAVELTVADGFAGPTGASVATEPYSTVDELHAAIAAGDAPDIALIDGSPTISTAFADTLDNAAIALEDLGVTVEQLEAAFGAHIVAQGERDGKHYLIPSALDPRSVVFFHQPTFDEFGYPVPTTLEELSALSAQMVEDGNTPWCIGAESGPASGWPMTHDLEEYVLRSAGPDIYDGWVAHEIPFDHPAIAAAAALYENQWAPDGNVFGGTAGIASINFADAAAPLFDSPPGCLMHRQGTFTVNLVPDASLIGSEIGVFPFPGVGQGGSIVFTEYAAVFSDRPEVRAFVATMLEPDWHCLRASTSDLVGAHIDTPLECHFGPIPTALATGILADLRTDAVRLTASDQMPPEVTDAFWAGMIDWVNGTPTEAVLATIEEAWPAE